MGSTSQFNVGDVILVPFPFTNQSGGKKRPAVVISSNTYNSQRRDIVILAITSQIRHPLDFGEIPLLSGQNMNKFNWLATGSC
jgi:mRNA interferase MazF